MVMIYSFDPNAKSPKTYIISSFAIVLFQFEISFEFISSTVLNGRLQYTIPDYICVVKMRICNYISVHCFPPKLLSVSFLSNFIYSLINLSRNSISSIKSDIKSIFNTIFSSMAHCYITLYFCSNLLSELNNLHTVIALLIFNNFDTTYS